MYLSLIESFKLNVFLAVTEKDRKAYNELVDTLQACVQKHVHVCMTLHVML